MHPAPFSRVFGADSLGVNCCSHTLLLHAGCRSGGPVPTPGSHEHGHGPPLCCVVVVVGKFAHVTGYILLLL